MTDYRISGVWKNAEKVITHYAFHTITQNGTTRASKIPKAQAVALLDIKENSAFTWIWDYTKSSWKLGEKVSVVNGDNGKFLRSNPDNKLTDNLDHLINFDWIAP
jgi:hypothetical protein